MCANAKLIICIWPSKLNVKVDKSKLLQPINSYKKKKCLKLSDYFLYGSREKC